jgi:hypothetical protein
MACLECLDYLDSTIMEGISHEKTKLLDYRPRETIGRRRDAEWID